MELTIGSTGDKVVGIQAAFGLTLDGNYGPITAKAVKDFQARNGFPQTGVVTQEVWDAIFFHGVPGFQKNEDTVIRGLRKSLTGHMPKDKLEEVLRAVPTIPGLTPARLSHFLAQCWIESQGFTRSKENLNYSKEGLLDTFETHFNAAQAARYEHKPAAIASRVYANRYGNGDEKSGDGFKFLGRGDIGTTFHDNYKALGESLGVDLLTNPDLVSTKYALASAVFYFTKHGVWECCDAGVGETANLSVTHKVNGGTNGLTDRLEKLVEFRKVLCTSLNNNTPYYK